ncbi:SusC/RagA family TonB-linked outer membrane protein [Arachidicoccus terrestris]|uniref:SusC/RagA family TonB-linked outer membrane protein n=1 Tax=Arachidicoccus terrestris TaxID=2875539 RepID=UPI001CC7469F|nr:SusC/RagA family TonB-linked outer membrane protein [Arachidicoccus terrestris]UAY55397.1 SusC/RagA family TonB-linked outer membrane protein [Arachidicoccus terrestris]
MQKQILSSLSNRGDRWGYVFKAVVLCCLLIACGHIKAQQKEDSLLLAQTVSYSATNEPLSQVLKELRERTNIRFTYNSGLIRVQPPVTVHANNVPFGVLLDQVLAKTALSYTVSFGGVVIYEKKKEQPAKAHKEKKGDKPPVVALILRGQVTTHGGEPLGGVTVQALSSHQMTATSSDGLFQIMAVPESNIQLSMVGMRDRQYKVSQSDQNKFVVLKMDSSVHEIEDVVINGYQAVDKRKVVGAVYTLDADEFLNAGAASLDQMIQGKVPGLMAINSSGSPTSSPKLRIRGTSTIVGNASPIWVVDGVVRQDPVNLTPLQINQALDGAQTANFNIVGNAISGINPNDIESLTFLKDASATAIYGVKAANGVIVVKTKKGKAGPAVVSFYTKEGMTGRPSYNRVDAMNSKERIDVSREAIQNGVFYGFNPLPNSYEGLLRQLYDRKITQAAFSQGVAKLETMNTDWLSLLARNQFNQGHTLSVSGGAGKSTYYVSVGYQAMHGTFKGDDLKNYTVMANIQGEISRKLNYQMSINASLRNANGFFQGVNPNDYALKTSRAISKDAPYIASYSSGLQGPDYHYVVPITTPLHFSIFNELNETGNTNSTQNIQATASLNYKIMPGLSYEGLFSGALSSNRSFQYAEDGSYYIAKLRGYDLDYPTTDVIQSSSPLPFGGISYPANTHTTSYTARNTLTFNKNLFGNRDELSVAVIQEITSTKSDALSSMELGYYPGRGNTYFSSYYATHPAKDNNVMHTVQQTNTMVNTLSYIATGSYVLNRKYVLNANIRTDGSNRFGQYSNQRFLPNWSVGLMWHVGDEPWFNSTSAVNRLDLRADYGTQGNVVTEVGPDLIASYPREPLAPVSNEYILDLKSLPYPDLRWEKTSGWDVGIDISLLKGRVSLSVDAYSKKGTDLIASKDIPLEYGISSMYQNYGKMNNSGWDGTLTVIPVKAGQFQWTQQWVYSQVYNKVVESDLKYTYNDYLNGTVILPGTPIGSFYSWRFQGLDGNHGVPLYDLKGADKAPLSSPRDFLAYSGRLDPSFTLGSATQLRYGNLSLTANFYLSLGNYHRLNPIYAGLPKVRVGSGIPAPDQNLPRELVDRWRKPGDEKFTNIPAFTNWVELVGYLKFYAPSSQANSSFTGGDAVLNQISRYYAYDQSTIRVANASYLRCQSIMLSYNLPTVCLQNLGIRSGNIALTVNNPFVIKSKDMLWQDPENSGTGTGSMPSTASYYLTMGITF